MIKRLDIFDSSTIVGILGLFEQIRHKTCTGLEYLKYIQSVEESIALFGIFNEDELVGFAHAQEPNPLDKTVGYIAAASVKPSTRSSDARGLLRMAERWLSDLGATEVRIETERSPRAFKRRFGFRSQTGKITLVKDIENE